VIGSYTSLGYALRSPHWAESELESMSGKVALVTGATSGLGEAIANTAGFHFVLIEQGGSSLYSVMALKVSSLEVLRIIVSIGGVETNHFSLWHDKAGNAVAAMWPGLLTRRPG
jgi:hypothetical protein